MAIDPKIPCWWETDVTVVPEGDNTGGVWPLEIPGERPFAADREIRAAHFEDIRRRLWLLEYARAGNYNLGQVYTISNWAGSWEQYTEPDAADPGDILVLYQDGTERIDYYTNYIEMNNTYLDGHPPADAEGNVNPGWRLAPNPNKYCHWNENAGNPSAGEAAQGRWWVRYHSPVPTEPPHDLEEYWMAAKGHYWLPRQVSPLKQLPPVSEDEVITERHQSVELQKDFIVQNVSTTYERTPDDPDNKPRRLTEYASENAEPSDPDGEIVGAAECEESGQCAMAQKMNRAYLDRIIHTAEQLGHVSPQGWFLKPIDADWLANWQWAVTRSGGFAQRAWRWGDYPGHEWEVGDIVWKDTSEDEVLYICINEHTGAAANEPGVGVDWEDYWITPAYNPEYFALQPVYSELCGSIKVHPADSNSWLWGCNDSAYELLLKHLGGDESVYSKWAADHGTYFVDDIVWDEEREVCRRCKLEHESSESYRPDEEITAYWGEVTQFDWWWDETHPSVPHWLRLIRDSMEPNDPDDYWPLSRGCWRRTWKHAPGRLGTMMWPGECGDPPGYHPLKLIISQAAYNTIPEANRRWYAVVNVEGLHAAAYGEEEEALIAKRHDPVHIRYISYVENEEQKWAAHPIYELHHDLVNDMRNVLLQLHITDSAGLTIEAWKQMWNSETDLTPQTNCLPLHLESIASADEIREDANPSWALCPEDYTEYGMVGLYWWFDPNWEVFINGAGKTLWEIDVTPEDETAYNQALSLASILCRIRYKGVASTYGPGGGLEYHSKEPGVIGFGDKTLSAPVDDFTVKNKYVRLPMNETNFAPEGYWSFDAVMAMPWGHTEADGFFDIEEPPGDETHWMWWALTQCLVHGDSETIDKWIVFDYDWELVPESVFEEDESNAVIV
jgi:hypothetical protein